MTKAWWMRGRLVYVIGTWSLADGVVRLSIAACPSFLFLENVCLHFSLPFSSRRSRPCRRTRTSRAPRNAPLSPSPNDPSARSRIRRTRLRRRLAVRPRMPMSRLLARRRATFRRLGLCKNIAYATAIAVLPFGEVETAAGVSASLLEKSTLRLCVSGLFSRFILKLVFALWLIRESIVYLDSRNRITDEIEWLSCACICVRVQQLFSTSTYISDMFHFRCRAIWSWGKCFYSALTL